MLSKIEVAAKAGDMGAVKAALDAKVGSRPGALAAAAVTVARCPSTPLVSLSCPGPNPHTTHRSILLSHAQRLG
eukprot:COSAG06_NODE_23248_length_698_cov_1.200334_1_plen_74_part_00